ncbi:hypothetical protein E4T80_11970 [Muribacter muris]|uniref:Pyridoxamine 5'-phosphate oxidase N-terminal domain-containing protein n=1 Tax=Muribacter muris TaxID=67855 RepID=A0A4Y9JPM5_9PAST|nr:pyridoxamine 5'-phosphate oxidase family protein [Muribacter muris]MBF0786177.1 pyridoxamine 5'-phosphate oxidase family protein [Muribacter muris]MBF0826702.1 pyridoxamine 5'-phosphate oxidase family protein [Muribacter muris]TFV07671.1 hypothetical protein E4T80_11970 [Muribacter muris]
MKKRIANFLRKKYLCTLCCTENNQPWANTFYYYFDNDNNRLLYISSDQTLHGRVMKKNPNVAGTIFTPTRFNPSLQGLQFTGQAKMLEGEDAEIAKTLYKRDYQHYLIDELPVWEVRLEFARLIDHSLGLFSTMEWRLGDNDDESEWDNLDV